MQVGQKARRRQGQAKQGRAAQWVAGQGRGTQAAWQEGRGPEGRMSLGQRRAGQSRSHSTVSDRVFHPVAREANDKIDFLMDQRAKDEREEAEDSARKQEEFELMKAVTALTNTLARQQERRSPIGSKQAVAGRQAAQAKPAGQASQGREGQSRAEQSRAMQGRPGQGSAPPRAGGFPGFRRGGSCCDGLIMIAYFYGLRPGRVDCLSALFIMFLDVSNVWAPVMVRIYE